MSFFERYKKIIQHQEQKYIRDFYTLLVKVIKINNVVKEAEEITNPVPDREKSGFENEFSVIYPKYQSKLPTFLNSYTVENSFKSFDFSPENITELNKAADEFLQKGRAFIETYRKRKSSVS